MGDETSRRDGKGMTVTLMIQLLVVIYISVGLFVATTLPNSEPDSVWLLKAFGVVVEWPMVALWRVKK